MARPTKNQQIAETHEAHHIENAVDPDAVDLAIHAMPKPDELEKLSVLFQTLSDPTRLRILVTLGKGPLCVSDIAQVLGVSESAVSHQLRLFRSNGLPTSERRGRRIYYSLDDEHVESLYDSALEHIRHNSQSDPDIK